MIRFKRLTKEVCLQLAQQCKTCTEFWSKYKTAADKASREGWIADYVWLEVKRERRLTRERCFELAKDCHTKKELKIKHPGVLARAKREGWMDDYTWLVSGRIKRTYRVCETEAKKYTSVADFRKYAANLYDAAYKNGWLADFDWLTRTEVITNRHNDNVYAYEFIKQHAVYVGRTVNIKEREQAHHRSKSSVYKFASLYKLKIPKMKLLVRNVTLEEGLVQEELWIQRYAKHGWKIINVAKTGLSSGSLGALGKIRVTKQIVDLAARNYKTLKEFRNKSPHEYDKACKKGWISQYTWLERERVPHNTWTQERCFDEAKKYTTLGDFRLNAPVAYQTASMHKWISEYVWLSLGKPRNGTWSNASFEQVLIESQKYTSRSDFMRHAHAAYRRAQSQGWLDELQPTTRREWNTFDACQKEAKKYLSRTSFARGCNAAYYSSLRNGWIDTFFPKKR